LEAIGKSYSITRERVGRLKLTVSREQERFWKLLKPKMSFKKIRAFFEKKVSSSGGVKKEEKLLEEIGSNEDKNYVLFLLSLADSLHKEKEDDNFISFWTTDKNLVATAKKVAADFVKALKESGSPESMDGLFAKYKADGGKANKEAFCAYLETSKDLLKTIKETRLV
jgi:hypothetical protein